MDIIQNFFTQHFNVYMATFLISCLPLIELRGGILFGMSPVFWGNFALPAGSSFLLSFLGSSLCVPLLFLIYNPLLNWLKNGKVFQKLANSLENYMGKKSQHIAHKNKKWKKYLGLMLFVAIPLPLTGVYSATFIACMLHFPAFESILCIIAGNLIAGGIITLLTFTSTHAVNILLILFFGVLILLLLFVFGKKMLKYFKDIKSKKTLKM